MKLKTLKDIYDKSKMCYISDEADETVDNIRKSAREWVKHLKDNYFEIYKKRTISDSIFLNGYPNDEEISGAIAILKHFFNLEDD